MSMWESIRDSVEKYFAAKDLRVLFHKTQKDLCKLEPITPLEKKEILAPTATETIQSASSEEFVQAATPPQARTP